VKVVGIGAGGHARVVLEILLAADGWELVGLTDPRPELRGAELLGVPVLGDDSLLPSLLDDGVRDAFLGLAGARDTTARRRVCEHVLGLGFRLVDAVHPSATVSPHADLGSGVTILAAAVVNAGARIGDHAIVNTAAVVEHDCVVGDHVHVATGAVLAGGVKVGEGAHVGAGATVRQGIRIGAGAVVALGAAVVSDVPPGAVVAGVPARPLEA
jgi:UDP-perosamine 4-acetyltransferase